MNVKIGIVYKNSDKEYFTPAQNGDFYIVDMWQCDKSGQVKDIDENPYPTPINTSDLVKVGKSKYDYEYPEFNPKF
jgi:hypothetical protein